MTKAKKKLVLNRLAKLEKLLSDETRWCQQTLARDKNNAAVDWDSCLAVRWCLIGGIRKVSDSHYSLVSSYIHRAVCFDAAIGRSLALTEINDCLGHAAVMRVITDAKCFAQADLEVSNVY